MHIRCAPKGLQTGLASGIILLPIPFNGNKDNMSFYQINMKESKIPSIYKRKPCFLYVNFRAYSHATENEKNVEKALIFVSGTDSIEKRKAKGCHGNPIIIMEATIKKSMEVKAFFSGLKKHLLVEKILDKLESRIDENNNFCLRFDKQKAFFQKYELVKHDDVVSVKGKIKCFPPDKDNAVKSMKIFLENL
jgi:RNA binding exosome subunit